MPMFVLHGKEAADDGRVKELVDELRAAQEAHGTRCAVAAGAQDGRTAARRAVGLLRDLGDPNRWGGRWSIYRPYTFPRLRLVQAIDDAAIQLPCTWPEPPPGTPVAVYDPEHELLTQLAAQRWRPAGPASWRSRLRQLCNMAHIFPAILLAVLGALLAKITKPALLAGGIAILLAVALGYILPWRMPLFLRLRRERSWFMTTTFLTPATHGRPTEISLLRPNLSWRAIAGRAHDVAVALKESDEFRLHLYVLALRDDLRDNHRRWSWDLRGFKRLRPPMLFLPDASAQNGGIELIKAISDVRSRRSELDPLLLVAAVRTADVGLLERSVVPAQDGEQPRDQRFEDRLRGWYRQWVHQLGSGQSPSSASAVLPWVLKVPLRSAELERRLEWERHCAKASTRPTAARVVWSFHTLVLLAVLAASGIAAHAISRHNTYCSTSVLAANTDTVVKSDPGEEPECIGIATGDVKFSELSAGKGKKDLAVLEKAIEGQNEEAREKDDGYVTVVYAGPMSIGPDRGRPVKAIEELTGVHVAQATVNELFNVGLQVLIANGGVDMSYQADMAELIAAYAERDPTVVGVVGLGLHRESSEDAVAELEKSNLPIVSGTNSATDLPRKFNNWFSLAATNRWQAEHPLREIAKQLRQPDTPQNALVLVRKPKRTADLYADEQARYGRRMLNDLDFAVDVKRYSVSGDGPEVASIANGICRGVSPPSVIYFAGRQEDIDTLMEELHTTNGCVTQERKISILAGDDLSKARFPSDWGTPGPNIALYHTELAALGKAESGTRFYSLVEEHLGLQDASHKTASLASGQAAMSHDATRTLYKAAVAVTGEIREPRSRAATWVNLRGVTMDAMATGDIDFTGVPLCDGESPCPDREGYGIVLKVVRYGEKPRVLCSRVAGNAEPFGSGKCDVNKFGDGN